MPLFDLSGITRGVSRFGNGVVRLAAPVSDILEIAAAKSSSWTQQHAIELASKQERFEATQEAANDDLMRKAMAKSQRTTITTDEYVMEVQTDFDINEFSKRIHEAKRQAMYAISDDVVAELAKKPNLSKADILRAVNIGSTAETTKPSVRTKSTDFDASRFTKRPVQD